MIRRALALTATILALTATPVHADTATTPARQPTGVWWPYTHQVVSTVTLDDPGTVTLVTTAYRHPAQVQARVTGSGTVTISDWCKPTTLPTTWTVYVDGIKVGASSSLKCA